MDYRKRLISSAVLLLLAGSVFAGYTNVSPPSTWDHVPVERGGRIGQMGVRVAANDAVIGNVVRAGERVAVNVGARSVTMPVAYRIAANSATVAARFAFGSPALMVGAGVAAAAYYYYNSKGYSVESMQGAPPVWWHEEPQLEGEFLVYGQSFGNLAAATAFACGLMAGTDSCGVTQATDILWYVKITFPGNPTPSYPTDIQFLGQQVMVKVQAEPEKFERAFSEPLPDSLLSKLPIPLPVEEPILNPSAEPLPKSRPLRIPVGDPQPVPDSVPQQWKTPAIDVVPSPTESDPWRVDVQPVDIVKTNPDKVPESYVEPDAPPDPETQVKPKPESEQGFCLLFPDILACAKPQLDTPDAPDIQKQNMDIAITPDSGWGGGGSCPASRHIAGANVEFSFQPLCDGIAKFRPLILAFAWLSAAFILVGMRQGNDV